MSSLFDITKSAFGILGQVWSGSRSRAVDQSPAPLIAPEASGLASDVTATAEGSDFSLGVMLSGLDID